MRNDPGQVAKMQQLGGRRPLPTTKLSRRKLAELERTGSTPLDVMIGNMTFWRDRAEELYEMFTERLDLVRDGQVSPEVLSEVRELGERFLDARANSQRCAVDAAPFVHPKIAPVHLKGGSDAAAKVIAKEMSPQEAMAAFMDSLRVVSAPPEQTSASLQDAAEASPVPEDDVQADLG